MKIIGITGLIASGKSTASNYISKKYPIIDADKISKFITQKGNIGYFEIVKNFGDDILDFDYNIDRKKLSSIVFSDKSKLHKLNNILHPLIFEEIDRQVVLFKDYNIVFLDAPLLFETNLYKKCNEIILICCRKDIQIDRIMKRDNRSYNESISIINSQINNEYKIENSNYIIQNNNDIDALYKKINVILDMIDKDYE